jgi:PAS domain S-box-containing protein
MNTQNTNEDYPDAELLINHMALGFSYCRMHYENDRACDFTYLMVNPAFEKITRLHGVLGKRITEVIPGIWESNPEVLEIYERVALTGSPESFESYVPALSSWFAVTSYSPKKGYFVATFEDITERKQAEKSLRENQELLSTIMKVMPIGLWVLDAEGNISFSSNEAQKIWAGVRYVGVEQLGEYKGWRLDSKQLIGPRDWAGARALVKGETSFEEEIEIECFDGSHKIILDSAVPLRRNDGSIRGAITINQDITGRKETESTLRKERDFTKAILDTAGTLMVVMDRKGHIVRLNKAGEALTGYRFEEICEKPFWDIFLLESERDGVAAAFERLSAGDTVSRYENHWRCKDGSSHLFDWYNTVLLDDRGEVEFLVGLANDITESKKLIDALVVSENEFRLLAEAMPQIVWITRADGGYIFFNQQWADYTGLSMEEGYGDGWNKPFHPDDQKLAWEAWQQAVNHNATYSLECRLRRADGKYRWWLIRGEPVLDAAGKISKWFGTCTDIQDIKQTETDLRIATLTEREIIAKNAELTQQVLSRNAELSALTAHIQKIADVERAKLAAELHDEMGGTLVSIKMGLAQVRNKVTDPDLLGSLSSINDLISHADEFKKRIINQLYPTILDDCGFVAAVQRLVTDFRKTSAIDIELVFHNDPIDIEHAYSLAAYRITQECLTNIAKHAEASKVHIEAIAKDGFLDLTIQDNGRGFSVEEDTSGHGIFGMTERAKYLGGTISFASENGNGTTIRLHLPLAATKPKNKKRVLVVDDHAIVRDALRHLLETQPDFSVEGEAGDGEAAVKLALEGEWDIVLLDITMPKKNGLKVLEEVMAAKPDLPIIMLSGHAKDDFAEIALKKGAACYLEKGETDLLVKEMQKATMDKSTRR